MYVDKVILNQKYSVFTQRLSAFAKRNTRIFLTQVEDHIFFPSASFEMYGEVCPACYVGCISLRPVLVRFLCCAVPQEAMGIFGVWHLQFLANLFIMCKFINWGTPKSKVFESYVECLISCDSCLLMSVHQKGVSQKVQVNSRAHGFSKKGKYLLAYLFSSCTQ